jgi:hypothetical protein
MKVTIPSLLCLTTLVLGQVVDAKKATDPRKPPKNAVLLSTVNALTLRAGKQTTARRAAAVPQLTCSGPAHVCKLYSVDMMRCANEGSDYEAEDIQWSCKASLPEEFKLGATEVSCEGYESSEDPYVLKGSCGVEYRLLLTELGEEKYAVKNEKSHTHGNDAGAGFFFIMLFIGIICLIMWSIYNSWNDPNRPAAGALGTGWGGGGGGGGGDGPPPPPYEDYPSPPKKPTTRAPRSSSSRNGGGSRAAADEPWRPGFWTGTAAGAAGGYAAGRYANRNRAPQTEPETRQTGGGSFGGGGPSTPSYSTSRHESTGFGGTSRR